jgi:hypothetical protein
MHQLLPRLRRELLAQPSIRDPVVFDVRGQDRIVLLGEHLRQPRPEGGVAGAPRREPGSSCSETVDGSHRHDRRRQSLRDRLQHALVTGTGAVDLVHEQERRNAQPLERPHQQARLRLYTLDGGQHQHGAVQHAQRAFDLRDEVGMPRRVDQVDRDVVDRERHDGRLDRDAALLLER